MEIGDPIDVGVCSSCAIAKGSATTRAAQKMLTLEELERNRGNFFILAITK